MRWTDTANRRVKVKETSAWRLLLRSYIINLAVFAVLCLAAVFVLGPAFIVLFGKASWA